MVKLTFFGGVNEIGGNMFLLEDKDTRLFLDFGMNFTRRRKFYSEPWLSPKDVKDLLHFGILPQIDGVYEFDESQPSVQGVFLSHPHADHSKYITFLNRKIPIYCGETTTSILQAYSEIRFKNFENDISGLKFESFRTGDKIKVDSLEVEPIHVDHSIPGAYGYIVHTSEGALVYTGDFRTHGSKSNMTDNFCDKAKESEPIAMLTEATNIEGAHVSSEGEVKRCVDYVVSGTNKIVLADFSYGDIDRFRTYYEIAKKNKRHLAISMKQAYLLEKLQKDSRLDIPSLTDESILIFKREKKRYYDWEDKFLNYENLKEASDIGEMQKDVVLMLSFFDLKELIDIKPEPGSSYILSSSEPFNEEMEIEFDRLQNWLDYFGLPMYKIHCSGHITPNELKSAIGCINPKKLFPIHTEHPERLAKFVSDIVKVELPKERLIYSLN